MLRNNYFSPLRLFSTRLFNDLKLITLVIFVLGFFNIFYKIRWTSEGLVSAVNLWNPTWLLFGPLLLFAYQAVNRKAKRVEKTVNYLHFLPFALFSIFYLIALIDTNMDDPWQNSIFIYYQNSFFVIIISLLSYAIYVLSKAQNALISGSKAVAGIFLVSLSSIYVLSGIIVALMYLAWGIVKVDIGIDYRMFSYSLLFFGNLIIIRFWVLDKTPSSSLANYHCKPSYRKSTLEEGLAETYKAQILACFENAEIYLDPNLSLESLSQELNIPKHYLSQLFNVYFKKNFHVFVAAYRIDYAIQLLNDNHNRLTIESLAYSCGFNSKTSFNRYFKIRTGLTPSIYQLSFS